jgi:hypothetical protein
MAGLATREGGLAGGQIGGRQDRAPVRRQLGLFTAGGLIRRIDEIAHLFRRLGMIDQARRLLHDQDDERRPQSRTEYLVPFQIAAHARRLIPSLRFPNPAVLRSEAFLAG